MSATIASVRNWENLSDYEFEDVVGDLLGAELNVSYERFARGADGGVDLRERGTKRIVQCKHYIRSSWGDLRRAARHEAQRFKSPPESYRFVTTFALTDNRKTQLSEILHTPKDYVYGREDLEVLLDAHEQVERRHVKLWLSGGAQLAALLSSGVMARSRALAEEITFGLPRFVAGTSFQTASKIL